EQPCCQEHELYLRLLIEQKQFAFNAANGAVYRQWSTGTVCKKDISAVHRERLEIERRLEVHLRKNALLTPKRLRAINQARFETARAVWQYDPKFAGGIMDQVFELEPSFTPKGAAAPAAYRFVFHSLGFRKAEQVAEMLRRFATAGA